MKSLQRISVALALISALFATPAYAGPTDINYQPSFDHGGQDFNHSPVGQTFTATTPLVRAGIHIVDSDSYRQCAFELYGTVFQPQPSYYQIRPSITVTASLYEGEGTGGALLDSHDITLNAPFMGYVDVDYAALGIQLNAGSIYTLMLTDTTPGGVTGWIIQSVADTSVLIPMGNTGGVYNGAYYEGFPISQGMLWADDLANDRGFHVIDMTGPMASFPSTTACDGTIAGTLPSIAGQMPNGKVNSTYHTVLTAAGGTAPYNWSETLNIPGLSFLDGMFYGTPTTMGTYSGVVTVTDMSGQTTSNSYTVTIGQAAPPGCTMPNSASEAAGKGTITAVGSDYIVVDSTTTVHYQACTVISYGGSFSVGQLVEWEGWLMSGVYTAKAMTAQ